MAKSPKQMSADERYLQSKGIKLDDARAQSHLGLDETARKVIRNEGLTPGTSRFRDRVERLRQEAKGEQTKAQERERVRGEIARMLDGQPPEVKSRLSQLDTTEAVSQELAKIEAANKRRGDLDAAKALAKTPAARARVQALQDPEQVTQELAKIDEEERKRAEDNATRKTNYTLGGTVVGLSAALVADELAKRRTKGIIAERGSALTDLAASARTIDPKAPNALDIYRDQAATARQSKLGRVPAPYGMLGAAGVIGGLAGVNAANAFTAESPEARATSGGLAIAEAATAGKLGLSALGRMGTPEKLYNADDLTTLNSLYRIDRTGDPSGGVFTPKRDGGAMPPDPPSPQPAAPRPSGPQGPFTPDEIRAFEERAAAAGRGTAPSSTRLTELAAPPEPEKPDRMKGRNSEILREVARNLNIDPGRMKKADIVAAVAGSRPADLSQAAKTLGVDLGDAKPNSAAARKKIAERLTELLPRGRVLGPVGAAAAGVGALALADPAQAGSFGGEGGVSALRNVSSRGMQIADEVLPYFVPGLGLVLAAEDIGAGARYAGSALTGIPQSVVDTPRRGEQQQYSEQQKRAFAREAEDRAQRTQELATERERQDIDVQRRSDPFYGQEVRAPQAQEGRMDRFARNFETPLEPVPDPSRQFGPFPSAINPDDEFGMPDRSIDEAIRVARDPTQRRAPRRSLRERLQGQQAQPQQTDDFQVALADFEREIQMLREEFAATQGM